MNYCVFNDKNGSISRRLKKMIRYNLTKYCRQRKLEIPERDREGVTLRSGRFAGKTEGSTYLPDSSLVGQVHKLTATVKRWRPTEAGCAA